MMYFTPVETTFGHLTLIHRGTDSAGVVAILLPKTKKESLQEVKSRFPKAEQGSVDSLIPFKGMLIDYFDGARVKFPIDVLDLSICYPFQIEVLKAEWSIPYGKTASYSCVAKKIHSTAYRAVGNALSRNPFPIIIPCHRAIRSDRTLGGFQGGLKMKRRILEMEGVEFDSLGRVAEEYVQSSLDPLFDYFQSPKYLNNFNGTF
ncbi:methylated-DNA--[protein]-cysteine S-methyltransferase [Candidatus Thorarchaeota archaeon]|nr:MAG: methylated-DNA--[protein]-cysteine S-methyltransferase [Candidatus Thorarchaeota archaeon]